MRQCNIDANDWNKSIKDEKDKEEKEIKRRANKKHKNKKVKKPKPNTETKLSSVIKEGKLQNYSEATGEEYSV